MQSPSSIFGRLGNSLFQYAYLYAQSRELGVDYFFQDPKYFEKYSAEIKKLFGHGIRPIDQVAIHLRRGDYVNNKFYVDLTQTDYYRDAIAQFPKDTEFLVFSDDIGFAKQFFVGKQFEFSEGNSEIEDLNLMASCKGVIMANSSYSWWGAYLGNHIKKVIYPKQWYSDGITRTVCPKEWQSI